MRADGRLGRRGTQQVDLDGDALAGRGEQLPAPEGLDETLERRRESRVVGAAQMTDDSRL
jgi:hypothetical protein